MLQVDPLLRWDEGLLLHPAAFCTWDLLTGKKSTRRSLYGGVRGLRPGEEMSKEPWPLRKGHTGQQCPGGHPWGTFGNAEWGLLVEESVVAT